MHYNVIGVRTLIENQSSHEHGSCDMTQYLFLLQGVDDGQLYQFTAKNRYGNCGSGYTSASWGGFSSVTTAWQLGTLHYVPKRKIVGEFRLPKENDEQLDYSLNYEEAFMVVGTQDIIAYSTGDGGDNYYPSGASRINEELFNVTVRAVDKRKVFVLTGPSGSGKSFLASHTDLKVYETDKDEHLTSELGNYDIIVVGNKYHQDTPFDTILAIIKLTADVDVVRLAFMPL